MNTSHSTARPPRWAEALLRLLLKPQDRESVSGDLLEEYRDTAVPTLGSAADRWYVQQVASFLMRSSWRWGALLGIALVVRYLLDTLVPPADYFLRATVLTYTIFAASLGASFSAAWRTRTIRTGVLIAVSAAVIGGLLSIVGTAVMLAIWHDPVTLQAWRSSGGLDEAFIDVPLKIIAIGGVIGLAGAVLGKLGATLFTRLRQEA